MNTPWLSSLGMKRHQIRGIEQAYGLRSAEKKLYNANDMSYTDLHENYTKNI